MKFRNNNIGINLSFDYEIFFENNFDTLENILIQPTYKILDILNKYNINGTFFIDILFLEFLERNNMVSYLNLILNQINQLIYFKQEIQLHVHPHWLTTKVNPNLLKFEINKDHYKLVNNFTSVENIIKHSITTLLKYFPILSNQIIGFRAGGFCAHPFNIVFDALLSNKIYFDSSFLPNIKSNYLIQDYDFSSIDNPFAGFYYFSQNSKIFEIPIGTFSLPIFNRFSFFEKRIPLNFDKGTFIKFNKNSDLKPKNIYPLSLDSFNYKFLLYGLELLTRSPYFNNTNLNFTSMIAHPKLFDSFHLKNLDNLLIDLRTKKYTFNTQKEIYEKLNTKSI